MKEMSHLPPSTRLLTIINVATAKPQKRPRAGQRDWHAIAKKAKVETSKSVKGKGREVEVNGGTAVEGTKGSEVAEVEAEAEEDDEVDGKRDAYEQHWAQDTPLLNGQETLKEGEVLKWSKASSKLAGIGDCTIFNKAEGGKGPTAEEAEDATNIYNARLLATLAPATPFQNGFLSTLSTYRDLFYPKVTLGKQHDSIKKVISVHALNHVLRTRNKVVKDNEYLSKLSTTPSLPTRNTQDQGFTRPKVLILLPFRNSALSWFTHLSNAFVDSSLPTSSSTSTSSSNSNTIENLARFQSEYSLPSGAIDKLATNSEKYSHLQDHVDTFKGNIDDSFRVGLKVTRKSLKVFSEFYSADVIIASPLGLRTSIEKEKDSDFLSSIEMLVVDQMDVMLMQNWEHVQFILERLNKLPVEAHGCDFSRVKPWYLDGKASFLRQTILLSSYETPEHRSLFTKGLHNVAGKVKVETSYEGVLEKVPKGIKQVWNRFEVENVWEEDDKRFEWFTTKTLPNLLKSAVSSSQTIVFVPSYFDFVRVKRYMKKMIDFEFVSISEYTPTPDVSRARGAFFDGKVNFLLTTERFHFFRRYRLRGAKTFVFYAPPEHAYYYPEILSFPYGNNGEGGAESAEEVDESELSAQVIFSKFDLMKLERICGTEDARKMVKSEAGGRFTFI